MTNNQNADQPSDIAAQIRNLSTGFRVPTSTQAEDTTREPAVSPLSNSPAIEFAQMIGLTNGEGQIIYYPSRVDFAIGDVLYLRERDSGENGLIVQAVEKSTAEYPQADSKALFRLMASVRAYQIQRSHHEPPETIDEFLSLSFKVRAAIIDGQWMAHEGRVVTRNVDIFEVSPNLLLSNIIVSEPNLNLYLGDYKNEYLRVFGGGFEKVNLVTGMKGGGKSHVVKGIVSENLRAGMSAIVFDVNHEYGQITDNTLVLRPGNNFCFRLDYVSPPSLLRLINRLAPFPEITSYLAAAEIPRQLEQRRQQGLVPDIEFLRGIAQQIFPGNSEPMRNMRGAYTSRIDVIDRYRLIMSQEEAQRENAFIEEVRQGNSQVPMPDLISLRTAFMYMTSDIPCVIVFQLGDLPEEVQKVIVMLVLDHLKQTCQRQNIAYEAGEIDYPRYPTVYFEEAHMYMDQRDINDLIPIIRHIGINVFFITNTPGALPDSVFRLLDNLIMTRMVNRKDIDRVVDCGLADKETIFGFAENLMDHHALFLSARDGATSNFPLVFHVRDFGLPRSGETKSQWEAMRLLNQND